MEHYPQEIGSEEIGTTVPRVHPGMHGRRPPRAAALAGGGFSRPE